MEPPWGVLLRFVMHSDGFLCFISFVSFAVASYDTTVASLGLSSHVRWHRMGGMSHVPSRRHDICIWCGVGQAFQCGGEPSEGKKRDKCVMSA